MKQKEKIKHNNAAVILIIFLLNVLLFLPSLLSPAFKKIFSDYIIVENNYEILPLLLICMACTAAFAGIFIWLQQKLTDVLTNRMANETPIRLSGGCWGNT